MNRIGIDLGGTKIEIIVLDEQGQEQYRNRHATPKSYPEIIKVLKQLILDAERATGTATHIGIGIPGVISSVTGLVKNCNATWVNGHPLDQDLASVLGRPVIVANDANCFAVSEAVDGAGAGHSLVFGVIIGTGCGGGIAINGQSHVGPNSIAGEWGHNPLPWMNQSEFNQHQCFCGKWDCLETFISGTAWVNDYQSAGGDADNGAEIYQRVLRGETIAMGVFERYLDRLARALAAMINMLDPDVIVLGGGVSQVDALYEQLPKRVSKYVLGQECATPIIKNKHGASSGVRGAAWL